MSAASSVLSKLSVATAIIDQGVKQFLFSLFQADTPAAAGSTQADGTPLTAGRNAVTAANGTKAVVLPVAIDGATVEIINTVSNQTLVVFPAVGDQINALGANLSFSHLGGAYARYVCTANGQWYVAAANLTGTSTSSSTAELDTLHSVTAGTVAASKAVVVDANKSVDVLQATTSFSLGGTGVPGAAAVQTEVTKAVTAFADTTAKTVFTITCPNTAQAAQIEVDCLGVLGAGGAIGAGESCMATKYLVSLVRTAGVNLVGTVGTIATSAKSKVAGADDITSVVVTLGAVSGAVGGSNTMPVQVAITRSGAGATNHTGVFKARILNQNATGITLA